MHWWSDPFYYCGLVDGVLGMILGRWWADQ